MGPVTMLEGASLEQEGGVQNSHNFIKSCGFAKSIRTFASPDRLNVQKPLGIAPPDVQKPFGIAPPDQLNVQKPLGTDRLNVQKPLGIAPPDRLNMQKPLGPFFWGGPYFCF